eukprot:GAHX01003935.1.p1 GENE.GAHX01003935.1~~GAHX01003935.1.p1  ORF type:complete len:299 (+),score=51.65 GAHX01003935.1:298-1194(+)
MEAIQYKPRPPKVLSKTKNNLLTYGVIFIVFVGIIALVSFFALKGGSNDSVSTKTRTNTISSKTSTTEEKSTEEKSTEEKSTEEKSKPKPIDYSFKDKDPESIKTREQYTEFKRYYEHVNKSKYDNYSEDVVNEDSAYFVGQVARTTGDLPKYTFTVKGDVAGYSDDLKQPLKSLKDGKTKEALYQVSNLIENLKDYPIPRTYFNQDGPEMHEFIEPVEIEKSEVEKRRVLYVSAIVLRNIIKDNYNSCGNKTLMHFLLVFIKWFWTDFEDLLGDKNFSNDSNSNFDWDLNKKLSFTF